MPEPLASGIAPAFLARPKEQRTPGRALWGISVAALAAASIMDAHSSWGKQEANSMLQGSHGRFGTKGIAIKAGVNSAWIVSQVLALRKGGSHRTYAILNFAVASVFAATSYHNYSVPR